MTGAHGLRLDHRSPTCQPPAIKIPASSFELRPESDLPPESAWAITAGIPAALALGGKGGPPEVGTKEPQEEPVRGKAGLDPSNARFAMRPERAWRTG